MSKTLIVVDTKLMAYTYSYQRRQGIVATLDSIESAVRYLVESMIVEGEYEVILGFDFGKSRYRKELLASYKGHRTEGLKVKPKAEQEAYDAFQKEYRVELPHLSNLLGLRVVGVEGVEFDDLGSIIAHKFHKDYNIILLTEDHDFFQLPLALPNVYQFLPKSYSLLAYSDIVRVEKVTSRAEFLLKKAVLGDSGDSIQGIKMCGKQCFEEWFSALRGKNLQIEDFKPLFIEQANSQKRFKIHQDYSALGVTSFEEVFDLNIKLGMTMKDLSLLNVEEELAFKECFSVKPKFREELFKEFFPPQLTDFGDPKAVSSFSFLRGEGRG